MEAFVGTWDLVPGSTEGSEDFAKAVGMPEELRQLLHKDSGITMEIGSEDGGKYVCTTDYGSHKESNTIQLGEWTTSLAHGLEAKHRFRLEGKKLAGEHEVMGLTTTSCRWLQGNNLHCEITGNGKTTKSVFKRA